MAVGWKSAINSVPMAVHALFADPDRVKLFPSIRACAGWELLAYRIPRRGSHACLVLLARATYDTITNLL